MVDALCSRDTATAGAARRSREPRYPWLGHVMVWPMQHLLKLVAAASLACASTATAAPDTAARPAAAPDDCRPAGPVLFEIDHRVDPGAKLASSSLRVFTNGAWQVDQTDADGKPAAPVTGCLSRSDRKQLEAVLQGASWKVTTAKFHCMAMSSAFTVYQVNGKPVFTQRLCSGQSLDDKSKAKLDAATAQMDAEVARAHP
jgi:hypothetical protein